jgi:hypothetical protein
VFVFGRFKAPYPFNEVLAFLVAPKSPGFVEVVNLLLEGTHGPAIRVLMNCIFAFSYLRPFGS